ncbi:hypothetical protein D5282_24065, partial [bacterium 1xD8-48]|nr:hypothetical protein [bacterium 1xD8-48]
MAAKNENEKRLTKEEKEMQLLLDSMLVPFSDYKKNLAANRKLEPSDEDKKLLKIVSDLEKLKKSGSKANIEKCLDMALEDIAKMMNTYGGGKNNVGYASRQPHKQVLPFLIQQVLFYIAALCIECYNGEQKVVIQELRKLDVTISHNFFSRKRTTPKQYLDMKRYTQPELPANYKGNKCGELAVAIKNLVYQSGEYDIFCDVFGGSGAASLAVNRRKEAEYVYNELDKMTQNLFAVIKDNNKYEDLIKALEALQLDLRGGKKWINSKFDSYIKTYTENKIYMDNKEHEILGNRKLLTSKLSMTDAEKIRLMENFHDGIKRSEEDFVLKCAGRSYSRHELLNEIFVDCTYNRNVALKNFSDYFYLISELSCYSHSFSLIGYNVNFPNNAARPNSRLTDIVDQFEQYRAYEYFVYFGCILNDLSRLSQDKVLCAVAKIFMLSFSFYGDAQLSNILRMCVFDEEQENSYSVFSEFVKKDFKGIITEMHNAIKGTICENLDCVKVLFVTLPTPNCPKILQIKRRYSII